MKRISGIFCAATMLALASSNGAKAIDLDFGLHGERFTAGYATGELYGLTSSGESDPTGVSITVNPYYGNFAPFSEYFSAVDMKMTGGFDMENGTLVSSDFSFIDASGQNTLSIDTTQGNYIGSFEGESIYSYAEDAITEGGYMTFSVASAPEPAAWSLMIPGVGLMGLVLRRRRSALRA